LHYSVHLLALFRDPGQVFPCLGEFIVLSADPLDLSLTEEYWAAVDDLLDAHESVYESVVRVFFVDNDDFKEVLQNIIRHLNSSHVRLIFLRNSETLNGQAKPQEILSNCRDVSDLRLQDEALASALQDLVDVVEHVGHHLGINEHKVFNQVNEVDLVSLLQLLSHCCLILL
jgi:hypothetical protein